MVEFADKMEREGWSVCRVVEDRPSVVGALREALRHITTTYTIRLDGDTRSEEDPGRAVKAAMQDGADLCSVKVQVDNPQTIVEHLQATEYAISMRGRHNAPWLTSGACIIAKTDAMLHILDHHSLWLPGEDMEVGRIAKAFKMRVRHIDFHVWTEAPATLRALVNQRKMWWCGSARLCLANFDQNFRYPVWMVYNLGLIWMLLAMKWSSVGSGFVALPLLALLYTFITLLSNWQVRSKWMILLPYYSLSQVLVMPLLGVVGYVTMVVSLRNFGRFRVRPFRQKKWEPREVLVS